MSGAPFRSATTVKRLRSLQELELQKSGVSINIWLLTEPGVARRKGCASPQCERSRNQYFNATRRRPSPQPKLRSLTPSPLPKGEGEKKAFCAASQVRRPLIR